MGHCLDQALLRWGLIVIGGNRDLRQDPEDLFANGLWIPRQVDLQLVTVQSLQIPEGHDAGRIDTLFAAQVNVVTQGLLWGRKHAIIRESISRTRHTC